MPLGYEECISYKMIGYIVPFSLYPSGYHCDTSLPLPFVNLASRKAGIHLYYMGFACDPDTLKWWTSGYEKVLGRAPDIGKGCIRFKNTEKIPYDLIRELMTKVDANTWIKLYKNRYRRDT